MGKTVTDLTVMLTIVLILNITNTFVTVVYKGNVHVRVSSYVRFDTKHNLSSRTVNSTVPGQ